MANETLLWLGRAIEEQQAEIERRWLEQVQRDVVRTPGVELTHLRDGIPDYLLAVARLLQKGEAPFAHQAGNAWENVAREHGITRVRIGFDISQLVHEFIVLRHVIREVVTTQPEKTPEVEPVLADLLDAAISASVQSYVDARDYDARRRQAESIGFLTHELRNPLTAALLAVAKLRSETSPNAEPTIDRIERSLRAIEQMIGSVLLTGKLEAGKREPAPALVRLQELLETAVEAGRRIADQKSINFRVTYDPGQAVRVDPVLTQSAIQNLVDNAAKYTDTGRIDVEVSADGADLIVDVRDTCNGISPEELRTIFDPFQRGNTHKPGTGLGLAIARGAVTAQGGTITADSSGVLGCHFQIRLPGAVQP